MAICSKCLHKEVCAFRKEYFCDANTLEKIYECPSYWLKGLELHEQERIANNEYKQRLVARKEAESVLQTVSDANEG